MSLRLSRNRQLTHDNLSQYPNEALTMSRWKLAPTIGYFWLAGRGDIGWSDRTG